MMKERTREGVSVVLKLNREFDSPEGRQLWALCPRGPGVLWWCRCWGKPDSARQWMQHRWQDRLKDEVSSHLLALQAKQIADKCAQGWAP